MSKITMYTDGSSLGNPGPGGFGIVLMSGPYRKELSAGFRLTTNNRSGGIVPDRLSAAARSGRYGALG